MSGKHTVDRVIGKKVCRKCGYPVLVESYSIPDAKHMLEGYSKCGHPIKWEKDEDPVYCNSEEFTDPKFEVIMKPYKDWINPLLKRMRKDK